MRAHPCGFLYVNACRGLWPRCFSFADIRRLVLTATRPATGLQRAVRFVILDGWTPSPPRGLLSALAASGAPLVAVLPAAQIARWPWPVHPVIGHHLARFGSRGAAAPVGTGGLRAKIRAASLRGAWQALRHELGMGTFPFVGSNVHENPQKERSHAHLNVACPQPNPD
jgi:hypothetical protein